MEDSITQMKALPPSPDSDHSGQRGVTRDDRRTGRDLDVIVKAPSLRTPDLFTSGTICLKLRWGFGGG